MSVWMSVCFFTAPKKNLTQSRKDAKKAAKKNLELCVFLCAFASLREPFSLTPKKLVDTPASRPYTPKNLGDTHGATEDREPDAARTRNHARALGNRPRQRANRAAKTETRPRLHHRPDHAQHSRAQRQSQTNPEKPRLLLQARRQSQTSRRQTRQRRCRSTLRRLSGEPRDESRGNETSHARKARATSEISRTGEGGQNG